MLSDAAIDRWSRQILLPEVGGRGQERLAAARVLSRGDGPAAVVARDLLSRAGVPAGDGASVDVALVVGDAACPAGIPAVRLVHAGAAGLVDTLPGRPCPACAVPPAVPRTGAPALAAAAARALGALAAAEVLVLLLAPRPAGRRQTIDLAAGTFAGVPLATGGCPHCPPTR